MVIDIIKKKRDGKTLTFEELNSFVSGYVNGTVPDYQMSALLMAIYFNGLTDVELSDLTKIMADSGDSLDLSKFGNLSVDKHSTGGVGDKTTLIVAPIVASLGCKVAKMSGRGLGFTGGTCDKLCSIPGYRITPGNDEFLSIVDTIGVSVVGQSANLVPADKKMYALRDVTGTVDSIPLIASSIMSKKIAAGAKNIVLDVKYGNGAFMETTDMALKLAETMVKIGKQCGRNTAAVISNMNKPLGFAVGNSLEVIEAINLLKGAKIPDLYDECIAIAALMLSLCKDIPFDAAKRATEQSVCSGAALRKFNEWISAQGGDISYIENTNKFKKAEYSKQVIAQNSGYISEMNTERIGEISNMLGAGRKEINDNIDYSSGIYIFKKTGDYINKGDILCTF
ncbi:MAG: thymidine phosphorylase, partial [Clostridia bacterium]|nr:thymidine phosphorylase [Clostridia bacterium]